MALGKSRDRTSSKKASKKCSPILYQVGAQFDLSKSFGRWSLVETDHTSPESP